MKNRKQTTTDELKLMSLFDGIGCFPLSYSNVLNIPHKNLNFDSSEIEPFLINILNTQFPNSNQMFDVTKINKEILKSMNPDIITMGTPCTGFSISGKRDGLQNTESSLFTNGVEIIETLKPKYFVWENVFGVFSAKEKKEFREILDQFKLIGYDVAWTLLDSKFFDLPQRRRRVYLIGVRDGIKKENNIFEFKKRQSIELKKQAKESDKFYVSDYNPESIKTEDHFAFYNRQRSDSFKSIGISSTLAKRDYKSFTDIVIQNGDLRRITPKERLRLQGIPDYWFDHTYETTPSDQERFRANGMAVPVVDYVFKELLRIESGEAYNVTEEELDYDKEIYSGKSSYDVCKGKKEDTWLKIPYSGQIFLDRDENGKVISDNAIYHLTDECTESSSVIKLKNIKDILLPPEEVEAKFFLKKGACEGILRRERESGKALCEKLKNVIYHKFPELEGAN